MKKIFFFVALSLLLGGCSSSLKSLNSTLSNIDLKPAMFQEKQSLKPCLPENIPIKIYVEDLRPKVQVEKKPSTEFVYSGSLFDLGDNRKNIAEDLSQMSIKFGGATTYQIVDIIPNKGPAIILKLENWYSRIPKKQENDAFITVYGLFSGSIEMRYDDKILASTTFKEEGLPTIVSTYIKDEKEKQQTPTLIWNAMLAKANSAQQYGYIQVFDFLQLNWPKFQN